MSEFKSVRRYYLRKRLAAALVGDDNAAVWQALQEAEAGVPLVTGFPSRTALVAAGYTTIEDVDGADAVELATYVGLSDHQAAAVLAALA